MQPPASLDLRTFVPAKDFSLAKAFYTALGFRLTWEDAKTAQFEVGGGRFFLQDCYQEVWAKNCMMNLVVTDVAAWRAHVEASGVVSQFAGVRVTEPQAGPHGTMFALIDPTGVLWHIQQR